MSGVSDFIRRHAVGLAVLAVLMAAGTTWKLGSPKWYARSIHSAISSDERYRLEILTAFYLTSSNYGFARLYDTSTGKLMCESRVEWLTGNGQINWYQPYTNQISIGLNIYFELSGDGRRCKAMHLDN